MASTENISPAEFNFTTANKNISLVFALVSFAAPLDLLQDAVKVHAASSSSVRHVWTMGGLLCISFQFFGEILAVEGHETTATTNKSSPILKNSNLAASYSDYESNVSISSASVEDNLTMMKLIRYIPHKPTPFVSRHMIASGSKSINVVKPLHARLALLHSFKEFSETLSTKLAVQSVLNDGSLIFPPPELQFSDTVLDKDPQYIDIPIIDLFVDISDFDLQDDYIPV